MSKITFRADDDLVEQLETLDASKSEVLREALRSHLAQSSGGPHLGDTHADAVEASLDDVIRARVDELLTDRLEETRGVTGPSDVNVTIALEDRGARVTPSDAHPEQSVQSDAAEEPVQQCGQCGQHVDADHVFCPNCGEKASRRLFCDCGDELRSDWAFCPSCGRRTPAADVLDRTVRGPRES